MKLQSRGGLAAILIFLIVNSAQASEYNCPVTKKFDPENTYTTEMIEKYQYMVKINQFSHATYIARCSYSTSQGEITCDVYQPDHVVTDDRIGAKKFYFFDSQFDVQLFPDFTFVENNGRGSIAYGKCNIVVP